LVVREKKEWKKRKKNESGVLYTVNGAYNNEWKVRVKALMK